MHFVSGAPKSSINFSTFNQSLKIIAALLQQRANCPSLAMLVVMETPSEELLTLACKNGVQLLTFDELENLGKKAQV